MKSNIRSWIEVALLIGLGFLLPVRYLVQFVLGSRAWSIWCGKPIINMSINAQAERLLGVRAYSLVTHTYFITNMFDFDLSTISRFRVIRYLASWVSLAIIFIFAKRVHTYFDEGIVPSISPFQFNRYELFAYRMAGLEHFVWTYGADVRTRLATRKLGEPNCCTDCPSVGNACVCDTDRATANRILVSKSATAIFSMGDMIEYVPDSRRDLFFWPIDLTALNGHRYRPVLPDASPDRPLRVVHAPNHREFKGTRYLQSAIQELRAEGVAIELVLVEKMPNEQALRIYRSADLIFDQCMIGFHGYFALEAMALAKPVMCFIRKPNEYLLAPDECPLIQTSLATLKADLRNLAGAKRRCLPELGRRGRKYIERHFTLTAFAGRLQRAYEDIGVLP